jgi:hypothetical protein
MPDKNEEIEQSVPVEWQPIIIEIVKDIRGRCLAPRKFLESEIDVDSRDIDFIYQSLDAYGDPLINVPKDGWETSICRWMGGYWHLMIDLFTVEEGASDLVLFVDVYEHGSSKCFKIQSVHVP